MKILLPLLFIVSCATSFAHKDLPQTVDYVDLERYMGTWYEIAKYPNSFQRNCAQTKATYTLKANSVAVLNECINKNTNKTRKVVIQDFTICEFLC